MDIQQMIDQLQAEVARLERAAGIVGQQPQRQPQRQQARPGGNTQAAAAAQERKARLAAITGNHRDPAFVAEVEGIKKAQDMLASAGDLSNYGKRELLLHIERRLRNLEGRPALPRTFSRAAGGVGEELAAFLVALELGNVDGSKLIECTDAPTLAGWLLACWTRYALLRAAKAARG